MLNAIDKQILKEAAGFEDIPKGAYNIRKNGKLLGRKVSADIDILTHEEKSGIVVEIAPGTKNESRHIPVILSQAGLHDTVYNTFIIGEDADVTIIAGCGIHCGSSEPEGHSGIHEFVIKKNARMVYVEKHTAICSGTGKRTFTPTTKVFLEENAKAEMALTQLQGVDQAKRKNEAVVEPGASLMITERVMTDNNQTAVSQNDVVLSGVDSRANIVFRSVIKGASSQDFEVNLTAEARGAFSFSGSTR